MPLSISSNLWLFAKVAMGQRLDPIYPFSKHTMSGTITGCCTAGGVGSLLVSLTNEVRSRSSDLWAVEAAPFAGALNHMITVFQADNTQRFLVAGAGGLALSTTASGAGVAWTLPVVPAGYRLNSLCDNNGNNAADVSALGYPYVICAAGDNGATGANTGRLLRSTDNGATWTDIALPAGTRDLIGVCAKGTTWLIGASGGTRLYISTDNALTFAQLGAGVVNVPVSAINGINEPLAVYYANVAGGLFIARTGAPAMVTSTDGQTWNLAGSKTGVVPRSAIAVRTVAQQMAVALVVGSNGAQGHQLAWTLDGITWTLSGGFAGLTVGHGGDVFRELERASRVVEAGLIANPYTSINAVGFNTSAAQGYSVGSQPFLNPVFGEP